MSHFFSSVHSHRRPLPKSWFCAGVSALVLGGVFLSPSNGYAQGTPISIDLGAALGKAMSEAMQKMQKRKITSPLSLVRVDPSKGTATIEFFNGTEDTLEGEIKIETSPPGIPAGAAQTKKASALLSDEDEAGGKIDSVESKYSMVSWFKDVPKTIKLNPGEKKSLTLQVTLPESSQGGDYGAWVNVYTQPSKKPQESTTQSSSSDGKEVSIKFGGSGIVLNGPDGKPILQSSGVKVVYSAEAK